MLTQCNDKINIFENRITGSLGFETFEDCINPSTHQQMDLEKNLRNAATFTVLLKETKLKLENTLIPREFQAVHKYITYHCNQREQPEETEPHCGNFVKFSE